MAAVIDVSGQKRPRLDSQARSSLGKDTPAFGKRLVRNDQLSREDHDRLPSSQERYDIMSASKSIEGSLARS